MLLGRIVYRDDGELMVPSKSFVNAKQITPGGTPTTDIDFYHRYKLSGTTRREAEAELDAFLHFTQQVAGYRALYADDYTVEHGGFRRIGVDIVYAVEHRLGANRPPPSREQQIQEYLKYGLCY